MEPALHADHRLLADVARHKPAGVACHCGTGEPGDVGIFHRDGILEPVRQTTQPRAQNNGQFRLKTAQSAADISRGILYPFYITFIFILHKLPPNDICTQYIKFSPPWEGEPHKTPKEDFSSPFHGQGV